MSSWALTSFIKNGDDQPSEVIKYGSMVETEGNQANYQAEECSMDEFITNAGRRQDKKDDERQVISEVPTTSTNMKKIKKFSSIGGSNEAHRFEYPKPKNANQKMANIEVQH